MQQPSVDLKIGCRYWWEHYPHPVVVWAITTTEVLAVPENNNDLLRAFWIPRDQYLELLPDAAQEPAP